MQTNKKCPYSLHLNNTIASKAPNSKTPTQDDTSTKTHVSSIPMIVVFQAK